MYLVPASALDAFSGAQSGKLTARLMRSEDDSAFDLLDTFDEDLRQRGMCLLQVCAELVLWTSDG